MDSHFATPHCVKHGQLCEAWTVTPSPMERKETVDSHFGCSHSDVDSHSDEEEDARWTVTPMRRSNLDSHSWDGVDSHSDGQSL